MIIKPPSEWSLLDAYVAAVCHMFFPGWGDVSEKDAGIGV
jgi:hypothetical protein